MNNKICIIGVYFGKFPNYFPLWLKSCEYNKSVDFYIFTDNETQKCADNIVFVKASLNDIKKRATGVLGFECRLEQPYKLCDYKPLYGLMFKDYVAQYDYWGHCDFDLIFGDLDYFFNKCNLYDYDRFLALGHLSLYRNTEDVNNRYKLDGAEYDYKETFTTDRICVFDELIGMTKLYQKHGFSIFEKRIFADIATTYYRYRIAEVYPLDVKPRNYSQQVFYWENGKCFHSYFTGNGFKKEEYAYIHFQKRPNYNVFFDPECVSAFYLTNKGFFEKDGIITKIAVMKYNQYRGFLFEKYEERKKDFKHTAERVKLKLKRGFKVGRKGDKK